LRCGSGVSGLSIIHLGRYRFQSLLQACPMEPVTGFISDPSALCCLSLSMRSAGWSCHQMADEELGIPRSLETSEPEYFRDFRAAMKSIFPSMKPHISPRRNENSKAAVHQPSDSSIHPASWKHGASLQAAVEHPDALQTVFTGGADDKRT
jgi:hypothetical protein